MTLYLLVSLEFHYQQKIMFLNEVGKPVRCCQRHIFTLRSFVINLLVSSLLSYLLPAVYPVPPQYWRAARCYPHSRQCVTVHLVLLYDTLSFFVLCDTKPYITLTALEVQHDDDMRLFQKEIR